MVGNIACFVLVIDGRPVELRVNSTFVKKQLSKSDLVHLVESKACRPGSRRSRPDLETERIEDVARARPGR